MADNTVIDISPVAREGADTPSAVEPADSVAVEPAVNGSEPGAAEVIAGEAVSVDFGALMGQLSAAGINPMELMSAAGLDPSTVAAQLAGLSAQVQAPQAQPQAQPQVQPQGDYGDLKPYQTRQQREASGMQQQRPPMPRPPMQQQQPMPIEEGEGQDLFEVFDALGADLQQILVENFSGIVELSVVASSEGFEISAICPPDETEEDILILSEVFCGPDQFGEGIRHVLSEALGPE